MKKLEKILGIVILISLILKFSILPFGTLLSAVSILILSCIYYPLGFAFFNDIMLVKIFKKDSYSGKTALRIIGAIGIGIGLSLICIGILFKLNHWPNGNLFLISGLIIVLICLIFALLKYKKNIDVFYTRIFKRIAIIGGFGLLLLILPELTVEKIQYRNHPEYIKAYEEYTKNPQSEELKEKVDIEYQRARMSQEEFDMYMKHLERQKNQK